VIDNSTSQPVYLSMCGPWTVLRLAEANRIPVWQMQCPQDFLAFELPPGRSVGGTLSLSDPKAAPYYLEGLAGSYQAEVTVYSACAVSGAITVETGPKYGELADCARHERLVSLPFVVTGDLEAAVTPAPAVTQVTESVGLSMAAQVGGVVQSIAWQDGLVAAGVGPRLILFDPDDLLVLGHTGPFPGLVRDVALAGGRAYLALGESGLLVVDLADASEPRIAGSFLPGGFVQDVAVVDDLAILAAGTAGFLDIGHG